MKIMVADDDRDMVDMLSYWLKGHGYDVVRAFDGEQAIKRWRETLPDLVILDVQMPKLDGFEVCRQMRSETNSMVLILTERKGFLRLVRDNGWAGNIGCNASRGDPRRRKSQADPYREPSASPVDYSYGTGIDNRYDHRTCLGI